MGDERLLTIQDILLVYYLYTSYTLQQTKTTFIADEIADTAVVVGSVHVKISCWLPRQLKQLSRRKATGCESTHTQTYTHTETHRHTHTHRLVFVVITRVILYTTVDTLQLQLYR